MWCEWPVCVERTVCQALTLFEVSAHALRPPCMRFVPLLEADYACNARGLCRVPGVNVSHVFLPTALRGSELDFTFELGDDLGRFWCVCFAICTELCGVLRDSVVVRIAGLG